MLPSGAVNIEDTVVDALSEGMAIEAGSWVKVVEVRGTRVVVRPTDERPHVEDHPAELDQSIESIGLDPFDDPRHDLKFAASAATVARVPRERLGSRSPNGGFSPYVGGLPPTPKCAATINRAMPRLAAYEGMSVC